MVTVFGAAHDNQRLVAAKVGWAAHYVFEAVARRRRFLHFLLHRRRAAGRQQLVLQLYVCSTAGRSGEGAGAAAVVCSTVGVGVGEGTS